MTALGKKPRLKTAIRKNPYFETIAPGISLGYRRNQIAARRGLWRAGDNCLQCLPQESPWRARLSTDGPALLKGRAEMDFSCTAATQVRHSDGRLLRMLC